MTAPDRRAKRPTAPVLAWTRVIRASLTRKRLKARDEDVLRLAALLTIATGPPGSGDESDRAFWALDDLLLTPRSSADRKYGKLARLPAALDLIPPDRLDVNRVVRAVEAYRAVSGGPPCRNFPLDRVVRCILEVPDPDAYVRHLWGRGMDNFPGMFHPNTIERAQKELRGVFGRFSGENEYWAGIKDHVRTVE